MEYTKGYKVFNPDWTCRNKQYTCPGVFEEDVIPSVCNSGIHFCKKAADCFNYYSFTPGNKVAEVLALGEVDTDGTKSCTNKIQIVREIPWAELLEIVNTGKGCTGLCNSGLCNTGDWNSGNYNSGNYNSGNRNSGSWNSGDWNSGNCNSGNCNSGDYNSGNYNSGNYNSGDWNIGNGNSGNYNSGNRNIGNGNSGNYNSGNYNSGDWNKTNFSNGSFNTIEPKIYLFNKPSAWTYRNWLSSDACFLLSQIIGDATKYVFFEDMTDEEKAANPKAETAGGYLKEVRMTAENRQAWWDDLSTYEKNSIFAIPNFDAVIFKEITGIDVKKEEI